VLGHSCQNTWCEQFALSFCCDTILITRVGIHYANSSPFRVAAIQAWLVVGLGFVVWRVGSVRLNLIGWWVGGWVDYLFCLCYFGEPMKYWNYVEQSAASAAQRVGARSRSACQRFAQTIPIKLTETVVWGPAHRDHDVGGIRPTPTDQPTRIGTWYSKVYSKLNGMAKPRRLLPSLKTRTASYYGMGRGSPTMLGSSQRVCRPAFCFDMWVVC
jgi:hypothetical protein